MMSHFYIDISGCLRAINLTNGSSGYDFKLAPAVGSMVAQSISGEKRDFDTDVPLSFFAIDRVPIQLDLKTVLA